MDAIRAFGEATFASLSIRNYRRYFIGIGFSHIGTWMQTVALGWLVLAGACTLYLWGLRTLSSMFAPSSGFGVRLHAGH